MVCWVVGSLADGSAASGRTVGRPVGRVVFYIKRRLHIHFNSKRLPQLLWRSRGNFLLKLGNFGVFLKGFQGLIRKSIHHTSTSNSR